MKNRFPCRFCDIINGHYKYPNVDKPIMDNSDYLAIASIGAIVKGWTLVVPKKHKCSMKSSYGDDSFNSLMQKLIPLMVLKYGRLVAFEHGSNREGSPTGCGINHAHMHIVPVDISLMDELLDTELRWKECYLSEVADISGEDEYLLYADISNDLNWKNHICAVHLLKKPISQFFRKIISNRVGKEEYFDYKTYPFLYESQKTRENLSEISYL